MRTQTIQAPMQVVQSTGDVMVVLADGSTRPVHPGEVLPAGSVLQLADNATLQLEPPTAAAQSESVSPALDFGEGMPQSINPEIAAIQQALLQGVDPTLELEATAAGGAPAAGGGADGSGNGGFVSIDRIGDATLASAGFDTTYQSSGLLDVAEPAGVDDTVVVVPPPVMAPDPAALSETHLATTGSGDVDLVNGSMAGGAPTTLTGNLNVDFAGDTGTVTFLSADSQPALTSGGQPIVWTLSADGLTLVGSVDGATVLTVTLAADGSSYTVDLDGSLDHVADALQMNFGIQAQNSTGDITTGEIVLSVADDNPTATDNENSLDEDTVSVSGNVLTDADDDVLGADGAAVTPLDIQDDFGRLTMDAAGVYTYTLDTDNATVQGLDDGESLVREFTYTLTDNDGDVSEATLTITITGSNDGPTIEAFGEGLGVSEAGLAEGSGVATDAQATGTFSIGDSDGLDDIKSLTIAGTPLNVAAGQTVADLVGSVVTTAFGQLTLDSFDAATGTFGYSYQLLNNVDNDSQTGADTYGFTETISLSVSDGTDSADTSFGVYIADDEPTATDNENSLDEDTVSVSGNVLTDADDDVLGADGAAVTPLDIQDDFGRLTMDTAGVYTYTLDTDNATVQGLDDGESLVREFTYTLTDNDGDVSEATLTITITGSNDGPTIEAFGEGLGVSEAGLPEGSGVATDAQATGTFSIGDSDGLDDIKSLTIAGTPLNVAAGQTVADLVGSVVTTAFGQLTLDKFDAATGTFTYSYQLLNNVDNDSQTGADTYGFTETISLSVSDGTDSADTSFGVYIADDEPTATDNDNSLDEDTVSVSGNVLTDADDDVLGADGAAVTPLDIQDDFGRLTMDAAGVYTYTLDTDNATVQGLDDGESLVREFTYTLTDNDGDVSEATLTITITGSNDGPTIDVYGEGLGVSEAGLPEGSGVATDAQATGTFSIGDSDGLDDIKSLTIAGTPLNVAAGQTVADLVGSVVTTAFGQLTLDKFDAATGTFTYSYQLLNNVDNDSQTGADTYGFTETISLSVSDGTNSADTSFGVYIADDEPTATDNDNSLDEDTVSVSGNVLTDAEDDVLGADGAAVTPLDIQDAFGRLTMDAAGVYTYTLDTDNATVQGLDDGESLVREFTYTLTDNDGDVSEATLTITITGSNDGPTIDVYGEGLGVSEAGLAEGSGVATDAQATGTFSIGDSDGLDDIKSLTIAGQPLVVATDSTDGTVGGLVGQVITTAFGQLTLDKFDAATGTFTYSYQLLNNVDNDSQTGADTYGFTETISLSVSDGTDSADTSFGVYIADDNPTATDNDNSLDEDTVSVSGNVLTDAEDDVLGADGAAVTPLDIQDTFGRLTMDAAGVYTYTLDTDNATVQGLDDGESLVREFTYTLTDNDGDVSEATLTITITGSNDGPTIEAFGEGLGVSEAGLPEGSGVATDAQATGTFSIGDSDGLDDIKSLTIAGTPLNVAAGQTVADLVGSVVTTAFGQLTLDKFDAATGTFTYSYQLLNNVDNDSQTGADTYGFTETISLSVSDGTDSADTSFGVYIADDEPSVESNDPVSLDDDALPGGNDGGTGDDLPNSANTTGTLSHSFGADGGHLSWSTTGAPTGFTYSVDVDDSSVLFIKQGSTTVMTLTLDPSTGDYTVTQNAPISHTVGQEENNAAFKVGYVVTDNDGDSVNGTLNIDVDDDTPVVQDDYALVEAGSEQDFNVCFVLDFSGSISDTNVSTMLNAVKTAAATLFNEASGDVAVQIVAFSGTASDYPVVTSLADLTTLLNSLNPTVPGGHRPYDGMTDFTAAVTEVMNEFTPVVGSNNQVFFISDGNPNEQTSPGNSLSSAVIPLWNSFVDNNGVSVTAIGVGSNINTDRLQDVDVDGVGTPIMIAGFDALVSTLIDQISGGLVSGNVISGSDNTVGGGDDDSFGADGAGRISSIVIDGVTYSWDGVDLITSSAGGTISGTSLSHIVTAEGGDLSFDFINGAWSYQAADHVSGDKTESFTYTIMDSDGDTASATLNVYVEDPAPVVAQVDEDELPGGKTDGDLVSTVASGNVGELVVGSATGVTFDLKSDTSGVTPASSDGTPLVYTVTGNTLVATAGSTTVFTLVVEPDGDYTFTLSGPLDHPLANGDDDELLSLNFASLLQADNAGVPVTLAGDFIVQVEDDVPVARFDVDFIEEDDVDSTITGSVILNDAEGADGAVVTPLDIRDTYGHLTMNAAGDYTYTINSNNPLIQGLDEGESLKREFTYTLTDNDGDVSTSTLTITINGADDALTAKDDTDSFNENTVQSVVTGAVNVLGNDTEPDATDKPLVVSDTVAQTLFLLNPDGTLSTTAVGTITFNSSGGYNFTLLDAYKAQANALDAGETMKVGVEYTARNQDGATDDAVLRITINGIDDAMDAVDDTESFTEDAVQSAVTGTVNVLSNDTDPDASDKPLHVFDTAEQPLYLLNSNGTLSSTVVGSITFNSTGGYNFTLLDAYKAQANALDAGETLKVGVAYTAINQDNATDNAVLRITINGTDDGMNAVDDTDSFTEDAVQSVVTGSVNVLGNDTEPDATDKPLLVSDTVAQTLFLLNPDGTLSTTAVGTITFNSTGGYNFTLLDAYKAQANALDAGETLKVGVEYTARNQDGATDDAVLRITINGIDDAMDAVDDTESFTEDAVQSAVTGTVNVLSNDTDPDASDKPLHVFDTAEQPLYLLNSNGTLSSTVVGSITFNSTGGYNFTLLDAYKAQANALDAGETLKVGVAYTAINQDNATDNAVLRITINGTDDGMSAVDDTDSFGEDAVQGVVTGSVNVLSNDTEPDATDKPLVVADTAAQTLFLLNPDGTLSTTAVGTITFNSTGGYNFTLLDAYKVQANALDAGETLKVGVEYTARNQDGATDDAVLRITINGIDDAMNAVDDTESYTEDAVQSAVTGTVNVLSNDTDPDASDKPLQVSDTASQLVYLLNPNGTLSGTSVGTITFTSAGAYTLALNDSYKAQANALDVGETLKVGAEYTARNQDGATDDAVLRVTITGSNDGPSISVSGEGHTVFEAGLPSGSNAASNSESASGQFTVGDTDGLDDITSITIGGTPLAVGAGGLAGLVNSTVDTGYGSLQLTGYSNGTFSYKYTLTDPVDNDSKTGADTNGYIETVALSVSDGASSANTSFGVYITDDMPTLTSIQSAVVENSADAPDFLGTSSLLMGADRLGHADLTANIPGWDGVGITCGESTLTSGEQKVYYFVDPLEPNVLYAYTSDTKVPYDELSSTQSLVFTLTYGVGGNYTLDMSGTIDAPKQIYTDTFNENIGSNVDYLLVGSDGTFYKPSDTVPPSAKIVMTIDASGTSTVNSSMQGLGVDNGWITSAEDLIMKFTNPVVSAQFSIDTQSGDATNMVTWTVHGMAANGTLTTQSGTTSFANGVLTSIPTNLTHITQIELSDESGSGYRVSGTNLVYRIEEEPVTTNLAVAIVDEDGDKASGSLAVTFTPAIEDLLVVGTNADDVTGSTVPYVTPADFGAIEGGKGDDILIGDEGRSSLVGKNVNIILMLDTSGSMTDQIAFGSGTTSRIAALRSAVTNLLNELADSHADNVRVDLISFNTTATSLGIFDLKDLTELNEALGKIGLLSANGNTNYEAALQAALNWVHTPSTDSNAMLGGTNVINQAIFISDGEPNTWLHAQDTSLATSNVESGSSSTAIAQFLGTYDEFWGSKNDDKVSEVTQLESLFGPIQAVGINVGTGALDILNQVEGVAGNVNPDAATNITTAEQLDQVLADLNPEVQFSPAGRDTITGGDGDDLIFGDALFTDDLASAAGLGTAAGGGWQVFTELEAGEGEGSYAGWDRSDTLDYINTHQDALSQESGRLSGADILDGGAGNDVLFGQEGDDQLTGGTGNDTMTGGSGDDTFIWRAADADGSEDVIKDFTIGEDKLDLQDVLASPSDPLSNYLDIQADGGDAVVKVYSAGNASGGGTPNLTIVLEGMASDSTELAALQSYLLHDDGVIK